MALGFPALKLASLLKHSLIIKPSYQWSERIDNDASLWPVADDIESIFENDKLMQGLSLENEDQCGKIIN